MANSILTPEQRYAAGGLLAIALRHAQLLQILPFDSSSFSIASSAADGGGGSSSNTDEDDKSSNPHHHRHHHWIHKSGGLPRPVFELLDIESMDWPGVREMVNHMKGDGKEGDSHSSQLWTHESHGLLHPVFRFLEIDSKAWPELEKVAVSTPARQQVVMFLKTIFDDKEASSERSNQEFALTEAVDSMEAMEILVACSAMTAVKEVQSEECESTDSSWSGWKRSGIIGAAALTGGTLLAISGGLAAPAIASGFSALAPTLGTLVPAIGASGFAAAVSAAGSAAGSMAVAASFGVAGAGLSGSKMARRIADIEEFEFIPMGENRNQGRLAVDIFVSGFVFEEEDFRRPWEEIEDNLERFALQWESKHLIAVSTAIQNWLTAKITTELVKQGAMMTVLSTLVSALAWPTTLLSATDFIDSKWLIAIDRSDKAGKLLADALLKGLQGNRPVTLVGFSLGARVIFKCLEHLAKSVNNEGLVEKVVLLGAPISLKGEEWESVRKMVAGRFVNIFSTNDWILGITFRASLMTQGLAGIQAINVPGIENVDVTDIIDGHSSYLWAASGILQKFDA
uniref:Transmembrane and coiled-coil domain-containing protein 4 isoform X4 n=1 Tax=Elaeis guineensis var. tenera TaxID=51953 RepID=A0A8N4F8J6_ELAGV|nr:transmembrane and coiled-coil domain-containing protein 4 isoform X4 [Elaeis guineensis]